VPRRRSKKPLQWEVGHAGPTAVHFTCECGRSVVAPVGSPKVEERLCGRCRSRDNYEDLVRRTA
jgi:hypothetical protein